MQDLQDIPDGQDKLNIPDMQNFSDILDKLDIPDIQYISDIRYTKCTKYIRYTR